MKVLLFTAYRAATNPYLELLVGALRSGGVDLRVAAGARRLPLLRALLRHGRPDIVHFQWLHPFFTAATLPQAVFRTLVFWVQWMLVRLLGSRVVWTIHNVVDHERQQERWELVVNRALARAAAALIVHCGAAVPTVTAAYRVPRGRVRVVPHGNYIGRYPEAPTRGEARRALGIASDLRVLLFFGSVRRYKGLEHLLEAFAGLEGAKLRLILLGPAHPPELRHSLAAQAASDRRVQVRFEFLPEHELPLYLGACDVVVLPYNDSLTSGAAVLAASYGRPILAPTLGCMNEFPATAAIFYDPREPAGLPRGLQRAMHAPVEAMGHSALRYIEQFPWSVVAQQTHAVYRGVLSGRLTAKNAS